ncbi:YeeE/YedE family protein [Salisediminibacterium halotolerans]|uniref:YeeE/YedE family protein n=1 Tax=Salisediminibacterium halotolerans TaxID=517425 RepID=UPI000F2CBA07|nr:YeeE/YedE family protein [Salisediminibacterium halotolerans]RLJ72245.1 hypothetical protein BCL39_2142 [Actinophytocola xinjiangensis]RPE85459.1 hypothetical protein EDD67_2277 [Salisediminibacterium halotolerans]TWG33415.1 hypothetical protein BCL52_2138 [Salisediminibacterium halotolerans]GEL07862.1 transporter [Salisediminibacterium halotolerans]
METLSGSLGSKPISMKQPLLGFTLILFIAFFGVLLSSTSNTLSLFLVTGVALGYILTRSIFGFAGGVKRIYVTGDSSLSKALLIMFAITIVATAGIHWGAAADGAEPAFRAAASADIIPGSGSVKAINLALILGGFIFGTGMIMAGGCASGTLTDLGEGAVRAVIVLFFFVLGSAPGAFARYELLETSIGSAGTTVYLPDLFGYAGSVLASLLLLIGFYTIAAKYEAFRRREGHFIDGAPLQNELPAAKGAEFKLFSLKTYHQFFVKQWSYVTGGVLLAVMFIFIINTTGSSWGVTTPFQTWSVAMMNAVGLDLTSPAFSGDMETIENGLLNHNGTLRNIGIILGSALALLLAAKFKLNYQFKLRDVVIYSLGGLLMGFGARLASGCNIGGLFAAISNHSLSGWVFMIALILGGIAGLKLFEGKINIIPPNRYLKK